MEKFYFEFGNDEYCYPLGYFQDKIDDGEEEIRLSLAKREYGTGVMWCKEDNEPIESGSGACGVLECSNYKPRNGKSGRCRHLVNCLIATGEDLILTKDGLKKYNHPH